MIPFQYTPLHAPCFTIPTLIVGGGEAVSNWTTILRQMALEIRPVSSQRRQQIRKIRLEIKMFIFLLNQHL